MQNVNYMKYETIQVGWLLTDIYNDMYERTSTVIDYTVVC